MKALFIGGPFDGQEKEIKGARHEIMYPDGSYRVFEFHQTLADKGKRRWIFAAEEGTTDADIMDILYKSYMSRNEMGTR